MPVTQCGLLAAHCVCGRHFTSTASFNPPSNLVMSEPLVPPRVFGDRPQEVTMGVAEGSVGHHRSSGMAGRPAGQSEGQ